MLRKTRYGWAWITGLTPREVRVLFIRGLGVKVELIECVEDASPYLDL